MSARHIAAIFIPSVEFRTARQMTDDIYTNIFPRN